MNTGRVPIGKGLKGDIDEVKQVVREMSIVKLVEKKPQQMEIQDEKERLVSGYASVQVVDVDGEVVPIDELKTSMIKYIDRGGSIIYGHSNKPVGKVLQWEIKEHPEAKVPAVWILAKIYDDYEIDNAVWKAIKEGKLTGFSIGATAKVADAYVKDADGKTRKVKALRGVELLEISLVETPANPLALFEEVNYAAKGSVSDLEKQIGGDLGKLHEDARTALRSGDWKRYREILGKIEQATEEVEGKLQAAGVKGEASDEKKQAEAIAVPDSGTVKVVVPSQLGIDENEIKSIAEKHDGKVTKLQFGGFSIDVPAGKVDSLIGDLDKAGYELEKKKAKEMTVKIVHPDDYERIRKVVLGVDENAKVEHAGDRVLIVARDEYAGKVTEALENAGFLKAEGAVVTSSPGIVQPVAGRRRRRRREESRIGLRIGEEKQAEEESEDVWADRYAEAVRVLRRNGFKTFGGESYVDEFSIAVAAEQADRARRLMESYFTDFDVTSEPCEEDENVVWITVSGGEEAEVLMALRKAREEALKDAVAYVGFGKPFSELCDVEKGIVMEAIEKRTERPPKGWWDRCVARIREGNPDYTDEQVRATCGSMWYHEWGMGTKKGAVVKQFLYDAVVWVDVATRSDAEKVDRLATKYGGEFEPDRRWGGGYVYLPGENLSDFLSELDDLRIGFEVEEEIDEGKGQVKKGRFWASVWTEDEVNTLLGIVRKYKGKVIGRRGDDFIIDVPAGADEKFMKDVEDSGIAVEPIQHGLAGLFPRREAGGAPFPSLGILLGKEKQEKGRGEELFEEAVQWVSDRWSKFLRRSDAVQAVMSEFGLTRVEADAVVDAAQEGQAEVFFEGQAEVPFSRSSETVDVRKPFGKWESFYDCLEDMKRQGYAEENAKRICGKLQAELGERKKPKKKAMIKAVVGFSPEIRKKVQEVVRKYGGRQFIADVYYVPDENLDAVLEELKDVTEVKVVGKEAEEEIGQHLNKALVMLGVKK